MGSLLGGSSWTGTLGSNLPAIFADRDEIEVEGGSKSGVSSVEEELRS
jgi:hypothetical protein